MKKVLISVSIIMVVVLLACILFALLFPFKSKSEKTEFEFDAGTLASEKQLYPTSHGGRTFYVAADGGFESDGFDGSIEKPFSLERIRWFTRPTEIMQEPSHFFQPGDQILLKRGDVFDTSLEINNCSGDENNPITIASYGGSDKRPVIEITQGHDLLEIANAGSAAVIIHECSNIVVRDLEINIKWTSRKTNIDDDASGITVAYDEVGENKYENVYIVNNVIHSECIEENKTPHEANTFGIRLNTYEKSYATSPDDVLTGFYCTNNLVYNIGRAGICSQGWIQEDEMSQIKFTLFKDIHMDNNIVHDVGTIGIFAGAATGCTMNRNLVYNTGMYVCDLEINEDPLEGEGGLMSICLKDSEIKYNVTYNNHRQGTEYDGIGIDIDWNCMNIVVQYNYVYACDGSGIGTMANYNCKILNNRVFDNLAATNIPSQISACDFVPGNKGDKIREYIRNNSPDLLTLKNLEIAENFVSAATHNGVIFNKYFPNRSLFYATRANFESDWVDNSFHDNHMVYSGTGSDFFFNLITNESDDLQSTVTWDKFYNNKYFATNLSPFICLDESFYSRDDSTPVPYCTDFESWKKRDLNSTFEKYTPDIKPGKPSNASVEFKDGKLSFSWNKSSGDIWHYNIYKIKENEEISYLNLLEQTKTTSFGFTPEEKGTFYIVIQPENNMGEVGEALRLKISLK